MSCFVWRETIILHIWIWEPAFRGESVVGYTICANRFLHLWSVQGNCRSRFEVARMQGQYRVWWKALVLVLYLFPVPIKDIVYGMSVRDAFYARNIKKLLTWKWTHVKWKPSMGNMSWRTQFFDLLIESRTILLRCRHFRWKWRSEGTGDHVHLLFVVC